MKWLISAVLAVTLVGGLSRPVRAANAQEEANAIVDKGIKALGGKEALSKVKAATWKIKGSITIMGSDNDFTGLATVQGLDHMRQEFEGEFGGNKIKGVSLLAGDKGSRSFGGNNMEMDKDAVANEKRMLYLTMIPITLLPLKEKEFKMEAIGEEKVGDKPAVGIKVTGPDGKDFKLYFDKESGLPVKMVAKVLGFMGDEFTRETTFGDYKGIKEINKAGDKKEGDEKKEGAEKEGEDIKIATKIVHKREGEKFMEQKITEFKILDKDKVEPKTFTDAG